jgi:hypothetical protein
MVGTEVESAVAVERRVVAPDSWHHQAAKAAEPDVEKEWPDARGVSVHTRLGTTSSENVVVEIAVVDSVASVSGVGRLRECYFGRSYVVRYLSFRPETDSGYEEVWWVM